MKRSRNKRKPVDQFDPDEILPEYDFSRSSKNKYAHRYAAGSAVIVLEPDVAAAFPNSQKVNEALRSLGGIVRKHHAPRPRSRA